VIAMRNPQKTFRHVREIARILRKRYGVQDLGNKKNPFNELLYIILSSKTPPDRYQRTYAALKKRFPRADTLSGVSYREVATVIKSGGLAEKRAKQIVAISRGLKREFGEVTLASLNRLSDHEAEHFLQGLPGIGVKVARCVLLFALGRKVFPVDAHCYRVVTRAWRYGRGLTLTDRVADEIQSRIPPELRRPLHVNFVLLGRELCVPRDPRCEVCPIRGLCETGRRRTGRCRVIPVGP